MIVLYKPELQIQRVELHMGQIIQPTTLTGTGLYAVCKLKTGWPLRVTLFRQAAELWRSDTTLIRECKIKFI